MNEQKEQTREPSQGEVAGMIADALSEDLEARRRQIRNIVWALGRTQARALLDETLQIEAQGGMQLPDGSGRRTSREVYFFLAYSKGQPKEGKRLPLEQTEEQLKRQTHKEFVKSLAERLNEKHISACLRIGLIVLAIGEEQTLELLKETMELEEQGGMMVPDGSRRRTIGGVFFHLAKQKYWKQLPGKFWPGGNVPTEWPPQAKPASQPPSSPKSRLSPAPVQVFQWEDRLTVIEEIRQEKGVLSTVKITLVGRPRKVMDKGTCFILSMKDSKVPSLPKGVPIPADAGNTLYVVFVAAKQWRKVAQVMDDPEDALILEGYPQIDEKTQSIAVFVSSATTKKLQQGKKAEQSEE